MRNKRQEQRQQQRRQRQRKARKASSDQRGYMRKLLEIPAEPGVVQRVEVRHDAWCQFWKNGSCNCDADVEAMTIQ